MEDKEAQNKLSIKEFLKLLIWNFKLIYKSSPILTILVLITNIVQELRGLINTFIFAVVLDKFIEIATNNGELSDALPYLLLMVGSAVIFDMFGEIKSYGENLISYKSGILISREVYIKAKKIGIKALEDPDNNNLIHRTNRYIYDTSRLLFRTIQTLSKLVNALVSGIALLSFVPLMIPVLMLLSIPRMLIEKKYLHLVWKLEFDNAEEERKMNWNKGSLTNPSELKELIITKSDAYLDKKYLDYSNMYLGKLTSIYNNWYGKGYLTGVATNIVMFGALAVILSSYLDGNISLGVLTFQLRAVTIFYDSFLWGIFEVFNLRQFAIRLTEAHKFFQLKELNISKGEKLKDKNAPQIEFKDIDFAYPNTDVKVLKGLNLVIKPGEKVAIVGKNGAGKTTLVKLLAKIYDVSKGQVMINDQDLSKLSVKDWYDQIGILYQDFNAYGQLTVRENIAIGDITKPIDENKVDEALEKADALDFVKDYKKGKDQMLSERFKGGIRPSGGQWQKIALARFFYRNTPLVIFDEPTAAIDAESEYKIFNRIYEFFQNKTVIIISHRFSTVRNADRIVVLDEGKIIEQGTHDDLLKLDGKYAEMFRLQAVGYN